MDLPLCTGNEVGTYPSKSCKDNWSRYYSGRNKYGLFHPGSLAELEYLNYMFRNADELYGSTPSSAMQATNAKPLYAIKTKKPQAVWVWYKDDPANMEPSGEYAEENPNGWNDGRQDGEWAK